MHWLNKYMVSCGNLFRDFMNTLRNFVKSVFAHIFWKFKYFAKQIILTEFPDHVF